MNYLAIDFEYKNTNESRYTLIACAISDSETKEIRTYWLQDPLQFDDLRKQLLEYRRCGYIFLCFNVEAEARCLISMNINPIKVKWFDIQAEYKMLTNQYHKYTYGLQMIKGKVVKTEYKDYYGTTKKGLRHDKPEKNLIACTYKLLKIQEDPKYKSEMIDLILGTDHYSKDDQEKILEYCSGDIKLLFDLRDSIVKAYTDSWYRPFKNKLNHILYRGEVVARTAIMSAVGYPIDKEKLDKFIKAVPKILKDCQEDIISQFPDSPPFKWNNREQRYSVDTKVQLAWIESSKYKDKWDKTSTDRYSLALDSYTKFFSYRHDFPIGNFPAQIIRYYKLKQSLNGFIPKGSNSRDSKTIKDYYGSDNRAHPYLNSYGSQTSRFQPGSIGFIPLKAAWMRSLISPNSGRSICSIDYSSQEFLIAAILANDKNMIEAYNSGDVYLYFAKLAGAVPMEGTKSEYKKERDKFKSTTLGIQYGMQAKSLALKLTNDTGVETSEDEAQNLIDKFFKVYPQYSNYLQSYSRKYRDSKIAVLKDGWVMFGDNDNNRSVKNFPIQGTGAVILRRAIKLCQDSGLTVIFPLHDALYIEYDSNDWLAVDTFIRCMKLAFTQVLNHDRADLIRVDIATWSPDYIDKRIKINDNIVTLSKLYIDERARSDYERFSKYFN